MLVCRILNEKGEFNHFEEELWFLETNITRPEILEESPISDLSVVNKQ